MGHGRDEDDIVKLNYDRSLRASVPTSLEQPQLPKGYVLDGTIPITQYCLGCSRNTLCCKFASCSLLAVRMF
eukprot:2631513-Amphidinium_carterae.1